MVVCELASGSAGRPVEEIQGQGNLGKHQYFTYLFVFPNSKPVFTPNCDNSNNNLKPSVKALYSVSFLIGRLHMQFNITKKPQKYTLNINKTPLPKRYTHRKQPKCNKQTAIDSYNKYVCSSNSKTPFILLPLGSSPPGTYKMCLNALGTIFSQTSCEQEQQEVCVAQTNAMKQPHFFFPLLCDTIQPASGEINLCILSSAAQARANN